MNFIITIKDESGHTLNEHQVKAYPKYIPLIHCYEFRIDEAFHFMLYEDIYNELERISKNVGNRQRTL